MTHDFTGIPDLRFPDINHCLVGKDGYDENCLRSYKSLEGSRLFTDGHEDDLKYHGIIDDGIILAKVGNAVKNFIDSSFFSTSSMKSFCFNTGLLLNSFRIALLAALFFISSTCWRSMSVWQETFTLNFVFLKDVVVVFQRNISRNAENFGGKFVYVVIASVLFSPLIRPFSRWFGLLRTVGWLNIVGTVPRAGLLIPESVFTIFLVS